MCLNAQVISDGSDDEAPRTMASAVDESRPVIMKKKKQRQTKLPMASQLKKPANAFDMMMGQSAKSRKK